MPVPIASDAPTLFVRKGAFERVGLTRSQLDERLNLTADEFGLVYFDDFFELSGSWPEWLRLYASSNGGGGYSL
jgi:hypothetical protein